jgi:hypothetical protein
MKVAKGAVFIRNRQTGRGVSDMECEEKEREEPCG